MQVLVQAQFAFYDGGWVGYLDRDLPCAVFVRFVEEGERLVVADVFVERASAATLRKIPLGRIEARVNAEPNMRRKVRSAGPDVRALFAGRLDETLGEVTIVLPDAHVDVPTKRPYSLQFYESVAARYKGLVGLVRNPVGLLADANHVPLTTAQKWVKVSRGLGLLPPGAQGKAG